MEPTIIELAATWESWQAFLAYKKEKQHMGQREEQELQAFIDRAGYQAQCRACEEGRFPSQLPVKRTINKEGSRKKRVVYSFAGDEGLFLKFVAYQLARYDGLFSDSCYAFRRNVGVKEAMGRLRRDPRVERSWCLKVDISNYFNSIDVGLLLPKLEFLQEKDPQVYTLLRRMLEEERVLEEGEEIRERHGVMAGTPVSPFLANLYLAETDEFFNRRGILYLRYSDDILLFAGSREELEQIRDVLYGRLEAMGLTVNPDKVTVTGPGETFEFLGFGYQGGEIDLSVNTLHKAKARIRRKSESLRRWQRRKGLTPEKAAVGLIRAMNRKFYGCGDPVTEEEPEEDAFTWSRWFFPLLTTDRGLKEIDAYLQEYIRYTVTGRHYKGNYRISYQQLVQWGYVSLVHEYYQHRSRR